MKLVLTCHQFLPEHGSGTEILTLETARDLRRRGHQVSIFTSCPPQRVARNYFDHYQYDGFEVERFVPAVPKRRPPEGAETVAKAEYDCALVKTHFSEYLQRIRPDVVHFFHMMRLSASIVDACVELRIPTVFTPTDFWIVCPTCQLRLPDNSVCAGPDPDGVNCFRHVIKSYRPTKRLKPLRRLPRPMLARMLRWLDRGGFQNSTTAQNTVAIYRRPRQLAQVMNKIDRLMIPSEKMAEVLLRNGLDPVRVRHSRYGIKIEQAASPKSTLNTPVTIGFIGTLAEHKGAHVLIEAFRGLAPHADIRLKLYGKLTDVPGYVQMLRQLIGSDSRISFSGTFPNHEISAVMNGLDALCVPSVWIENTPLVIYSAFASGVPVIATNLGGMAEVVEHGKTGLLFPTGDVTSLRQILAEIVERPQQLLDLSANIKPPKSITQYADELCKVYQELTATACAT